MKTASAGEMQEHFDTYLKECEEKPIVIIKNGKPIAVLVAVMEDEDVESVLLASNPRFRHLLDAATQRIQQTGGIKHDEFWQSVETDQ